MKMVIKMHSVNPKEDWKWKKDTSGANRKQIRGVLTILIIKLIWVPWILQLKIRCKIG
jgi:hypothetical protein